MASSGHPRSKNVTLSKGVDVSKWQGAIDWERVRAADIEFAIIRSSQSKEYSDPLFEANWAGALANGINAQPYHYFVADCSATSEKEVSLPFVRHGVEFGNGGQLNYESNLKVEASVMAQVEHLRSRLKIHFDCTVFIDVEQGSNESATPDQLYDQVRLFVKLLRAKGYQHIGIYTSPNFWANRVNWAKDETVTLLERLSACELWIAHWDAVEPTVPEMWKRAGKDWRWWQYSSKGHVDGIKGPVDLDYSR